MSPGILPGCPGPLAVFKKFVQKNFVRIFRSLTKRAKSFHNFSHFFTLFGTFSEFFLQDFST